MITARIRQHPAAVKQPVRIPVQKAAGQTPNHTAELGHKGRGKFTR